METTISLRTENPTKAFFELLAPVFKLSPREVDVIVALWDTDPDRPGRFALREKLVGMLGFKNPRSLYVYMGYLANKGILVRQAPGKYIFNPALDLRWPIEDFVISFNVRSKSMVVA